MDEKSKKKYLKKLDTKAQCLGFASFVVFFTVFFDKTFKEIAQVLGEPVSTFQKFYTAYVRVVEKEIEEEMNGRVTVNKIDSLQSSNT